MSKQLAFPGAQGCGAYAAGGRDGQLIHVTNLNDGGPGSLRAAIEAKGPRTIYFDVHGYIDLQRSLKIRNPYVTIDGLNAPGQGICIRGNTLEVQTHDVVLRYIRSRLGDDKITCDPEDGDCLQITLPEGIDDPDCIPHDIIVDHCSFSWSTDELVSLWNSQWNTYEEHPQAPTIHNITFQWCIFSEPLAKSLHPEGNHSCSLLLGSGTDLISVHHCLFAHSNHRHPLTRAHQVELVNNLFYNTGLGTNLSSKLERKGDPSVKMNYIGNTRIPGPNTPEGYMLLIAPPSCNEPNQQKDHKVYLRDNDYQGQTTWNELVGCGWGSSGGPADKRFQSPSMHIFGGQPIHTQTAHTSALDILEHAGCSGLMRDAADQRVVEDVEKRTGGFIDTPTEVGGWPVLIDFEKPEPEPEPEPELPVLETKTRATFTVRIGGETWEWDLGEGRCLTD